MQVSLVLSQRRLHDGQNHLFCDVKISGFKNWFIEVWMSAETGRVTISRFSSDTDEQKQVLQETVSFCVLQIRWLAATDTPSSSSKTTCSIFATSWWVLKLKGTSLMMDSLRFKAHKKFIKFNAEKSEVLEAAECFDQKPKRQKNTRKLYGYLERQEEAYRINKISLIDFDEEYISSKNLLAVKKERKVNLTTRF